MIPHIVVLSFFLLGAAQCAVGTILIHYLMQPSFLKLGMLVFCLFASFFVAWYEGKAIDKWLYGRGKK